MLPFIDPGLTLESSSKGNVRTLPEIVDFHIRNNHNHLFCIQAEKKLGEGRSLLTEVTYTKLRQAILHCQLWLSTHFPETHSPIKGADGTVEKSAPVALFMDSDLGLVVYVLTLMGLGVPVVLLSTRLSPLAIRHLIQRTSAKSVIVSQRLRPILLEGLSDFIAAPNARSQGSPSHLPNSAQNGKDGVCSPIVCTAATYEAFIGHTADADGSVVRDGHFVSDEDRHVLILHSSGTSGLPKPIYCSHQHFLGFARCHDFNSPMDAQGLTISTSPFFHGFGLVPICMSLGVGKSFCIPAPSEIPTGSSIVELIEDSGAKSLLTVPSILEEIAGLPGERGICALQSLDFVAFGGGLPKSSVGSKLDLAGVRLINHYGATETGPLTPFWVPPPGHDWHYIRLRQDIGGPMSFKLETQPELGQHAFKLSMKPFGWQERFELQDLLVSKPGSSSGEFSIMGRTDDLICLATGEKVRPAILESSLQQHHGVKAAVAFGDQQFELGVIVESLEPLEDGQIEGFKESLWPLIEEAGRQMDAHARITTPSAIMVVSPGALPRSDKGTILRREVNTRFSEAITTIYQNIGALASLTIDLACPVDSIRALVRDSVVWRAPNPDWSDDDDFFDLGMDSLQATKLRRFLVAAMRAIHADDKSDFDPGIITQDFVYRNASVNKLVKALTMSTPMTDNTGELATLNQLIDEYSCRERSPESPPKSATVVVTGSTGSLGSYFLRHLLKDASVGRIICLLRPSHEDGLERQKQALESRGIGMHQDLWSNVEVHQSNLEAPYLGLRQAEYDKIALEMTHVVHIAWPMNFNLLLRSFNSTFRALQNLIKLSSKAHSMNPHLRPRLVFISSISTVGNYPIIHGESFVPEVPMQDHKCTLDLGYAKAKWVCERMIQRARLDYPEIEAGYCRVGQIAGALNGFWNTDEHFVALVGSSKKIGKFPDLRGTLSWMPVDSAAAALADILFDQRPLQLVYHLENPVRQSWQDVVLFLTSELNIARESIVPFQEWLSSVVASPSDEGNPAKKLSGFLENEFRKMSCGQVILDTSVSRSVSSTMSKMGPVEDEQLRAYLEFWRSMSILY